MKVLASVFLLVAAASAADVDKTEPTQGLRGIQDKAKADFAKAMSGGHYPRGNYCGEKRGCSHYDFCPSSGCGQCNMATDRCTEKNNEERTPTDAGGNNPACPAMKGCSSYDYCYTSGCGPCDMSKDECTQYDPNNRDTGGMRNACLTTGGCKHYDYCADMGCGECDMSKNSCTMPEDYMAKKEE